jgi:GT2 family glycosyltransferase
MTPPLSVVIPSFCRADLLGLCLRSVVRFAPSGTEIVVVDDASVGGVISRTAAEFPGVRVVRLAKRSGFCVAANAGIAGCSARVVELLNDDAEVTAGWAEAALRWFADAEVGAVAPLVLQNDPGRAGPPLIDSAGDEYDPGGFARKRGHGQPPDAMATAGPVWGVSAAAAFYRRSAVLAVGGFPADFGAYFEDVDLSFRLRRRGFRVWYDPASVVWHRVSASYGKRPDRRTLELQSRNEERVFWRNVRGRDRWRYLPRHAAVLAGKAARRLSEGTFVPWAMGRIRAWAGG